MIVPMKKVSLFILKSEKEKALKKLRRLGLLHIEISEGSGLRLNELKGQLALIEKGIFTIGERAKKCQNQQELSTDESLKIAEDIEALTDEEKFCIAEIAVHSSELERLKAWGEINPDNISELRDKGVHLSLYEMPPAEYDKLDSSVKTILFERTKSIVRFLLIKTDTSPDELSDIYRVKLSEISTAELKEKIAACNKRIAEINQRLISYAVYLDAMHTAIAQLQKETLIETYMSGMAEENLSSDEEKRLELSYFSGYIPSDELEKLRAEARENSWGILAEDPSEEDDVPTKLKNNKFVSLIYPLTDFLGTVPGYFEFDISAWFLGFILIFFGIIFGDGGYGLLILAIAAVPIIRSLIIKKPIPHAFLLVGLLGLATVLWGTLTCTWFGLSPDALPSWLRALSLPFISNVYSDKIWYPFWSDGAAGLTTAQNIQILCFSLALVQLSVAHIKCVWRNRKSPKLLGDIGAIMQLIGMFYIVMMLVVNGEVFTLGLSIGGFPVGITAVSLIGIGFTLNFVFSNYEGSIAKSILASLTNIVSVLLGVVNIFSDIVSYIRLWAVGLAGAAISATVNELAGPLIGNFVFIIFAIIILVFGHGLNMILNILSVIVHGIRLNTLEFSSHLDMSWSGHKYKPFEE